MFSFIKRNKALTMQLDDIVQLYMYHKGKLGKMFLQVMVLWDVTCLQIKVVHIFL